MPDVGERLEKVEQGLTELGQRVDERFDEVKHRFDKVDGRLGEVDRRLDALGSEVHSLRVLAEQNEERIKLVAEVQGHHGETLQRLDDAVEPLKALHPVFEKVVKDHEERIAALERARH